MAEQFVQAIGSTRKYGRTLTADGRTAITGVYTGAETFVPSLWRGDDQAAIDLPTSGGAWDDATAGTWTLTVTAADIADLEPGAYLLRVLLEGSADGEPREVLRVAYRLQAAPGAGTARAVYGTADDMMRHAGNWLDKIQTDDDQTGFAEQRADARDWLEDILHRHFGGAAALGRGYVGLAHWGGGRSEWLAEELAADHLILTRQVKDACALYAIGLVCRRQVGGGGEDDPWPGRAGDYFGRAEAVAMQTTVELDTDSDGIGEVTIDLSFVPSIRA